MNNLLSGHALRLSEDAIRQHVLAYACAEVRELCITDTIQQTTDYTDWKAAIDEFDQRRRTERLRREREMETFLRR